MDAVLVLTAEGEWKEEKDRVRARATQATRGRDELHEMFDDVGALRDGESSVWASDASLLISPSAVSSAVCDDVKPGAVAV